MSVASTTQASTSVNGPAPAEQVLQIATGYMASISLFTAAHLGIADKLASGPKHIDELAKLTNSNADHLYRVLRALAMTGIFTEVAPRRFALTPSAETLRTDHPESIFPLVHWLCDPFHLRLFADLPHSVATGEITFDHVYKKPVFEYLPGDATESQRFNDAMTGLSQMVVPAVLEAYDFSGIGTLLDVAGGHGALLCSILARYPGMKGMLVDLPSVVEGTVGAVAARGMKDRCSVSSGDFFHSVPRGADAIIMKHIIHDWEDSKAITILKHCREALAGKAGAKIILVESVLPEGNEPHMGKFIDLEMIAFTGGRERTQEDFRVLFEKSGLTLSRVVPTKSPLWIVEGAIA